MNTVLMRKMITRLQEAYPVAFKAAYPRMIQTPKGYTDPLSYAAMLVGHILVVQDTQMSELAHRTAYSISLVLMANKVPIYFVADEFAQAVANTDLPGDFKFAELKWPMQAQVFALSDTFRRAYFGNDGAPFISISHVKDGAYPRDFPRLPRIDLPLPTLATPMDRIVMDYCYYGTEVPITYNSSYPMSEGIGIFKDSPWYDATIAEEILEPGLAFNHANELEGEQQNEFCQRAQQLAIKLLLTVAELPSMVEHGKVTRHALVTQQGQVKLPQLYSPNIIGRTYKIPRKYSTATVSAGTRAKPKFKYRRGHRVWQAIRYKAKIAEFVPVDQMPRTPEGYIDFDAAGPELQAKFYACHERKWIEGFFFDDGGDEIKPEGPAAQSSPGATQAE